MSSPISKDVMARFKCDIAEIDTDEVIRGLNALAPDQRTASTTKFAEFYPAITQAFARKVPQKNILAYLASKGLKLHPAKFRAMLSTEASHRDEHGELTCCVTCGAVLEPPEGRRSVHATNDPHHHDGPVKATMSKESMRDSKADKQGGVA